jgi:hypothetical protein
MKGLKKLYLVLFILSLLTSIGTFAQDATVNAKVDAVQIMVGDQVRLFLEAKHNQKQGRLEWATIPDTFTKLEVVEKGKIDTIVAGDIVTLKQRLLVSGFDSGVFTIPSITFTAIPNSGEPYTMATDSFRILVQTVPVDTTQPFKNIKDIMGVKATWLDYIWYIIGVVIFIVLLVVVIVYFLRNKKTAAPVIVPSGPVETLTEKTLRLLNELEGKQLWEHGQVKEYYIELTDILRTYIEVRFKTRALELTTDEILQQARKHKEMVRHIDQLRTTLETADLAKFAKAEPLPQEHMDAMDLTKQFVKVTKPVIKETPTQS